MIILFKHSQSEPALYYKIPLCVLHLRSVLESLS